MLHPHTELKFVSQEIGYGVFATQKILKGTMVWVLDQLDRIITRDEASRITGPNWINLDKYTYNDRNGNYVFCWDLTRYVNHSFEPNSMLTSMDFEVAIKDIEVGDEITNDYGTLNCPETFECATGPYKNRQTVRPDDLITYHQQWDKQVASAMKLFHEVTQPLSEFLPPDKLQMVEDIRSGKMALPSVLLNHYYPTR